MRKFMFQVACHQNKVLSLFYDDGTFMERPVKPEASTGYLDAGPSCVVEFARWRIGDGQLQYKLSKQTSWTDDDDYVQEAYKLWRVNRVMME